MLMRVRWDPRMSRKQVFEFVVAYRELNWKGKNFRAKKSCCGQHTWCSDSPSRMGELNAAQGGDLVCEKRIAFIQREMARLAPIEGWDENRASSFSQQDRCTDTMSITVFLWQTTLCSLFGKCLVYIFTNVCLFIYLDSIRFCQSLIDVSLYWKHQINPTSL